MALLERCHARSRLYVLGSYERQANTVFEQQCRALVLASALKDRGECFAIVGGGIAGLTAASALASLGKTVLLVEHSPLLLPA